MFNYYDYNVKSIYSQNYSWDMVCFCKSEKVSLEYLFYSRNNTKK